MAPGRELTIMIGAIAAVAIAAAAYQASVVFAPLVLALFIIALVWPLQRELQSRMPTLIALAITLSVIVGVFFAFASLVVWSFGRVGRTLAADTARYQVLYDNLATWLETHGISISGFWAEHFNVAWILRAAQQLTGRVNTTLTFWFVALIYVVLALLEVDAARSRVEALRNPEAARLLLAGTAATAAKLRKYVLVRTAMSAVTGVLVFALTFAAGLPFAAEWGVIAFALNYIPVIGPFIATLFPTLLAMTQFETWQAVLAIFLCLNVIQFVVGSYVEPRVAGNALSISPPVVVFAIFFWTYLWGLFGAFIGVPIAIAIITFCSQHPSSRWVSDLLGGSDGAPAEPRR